MKIKRLLFLFSLPLLLAACTSYKNVPYLQNPEAVNDFGEILPLYDAKIMPKDLLSITVNTTDPQAAAPFNLTVQTPLNAAGMARKKQLVLLEGGEGVDLDKYSFSDNRADKTIFLMVARVLYDKGYEEVVEAAKIVKRTHPEVEVQLLGPVDEAYPNAVSREQIRKDEESGAITYLGYTTEPAKLMGRPGISLLLSSYHEGLNRSLMEGCALGKPIIASDIPGCRETVREGENGYLVPPKDVNALADAMLRYLSLSDEEKESMSINSRRLAEERFDIKYVKSCYERILQEYDS